jgi:hypothetical protein
MFPSITIDDCLLSDPACSLSLVVSHVKSRIHISRPCLSSISTHGQFSKQRKPKQRAPVFLSIPSLHRGKVESEWSSRFYVVAFFILRGTQEVERNKAYPSSECQQMINQAISFNAIELTFICGRWSMFVVAEMEESRIFFSRKR